MHMPVCGGDKIQQDRPDYLSIFAWSFAEEIIKQQHEDRRLGGKFILPLPKPVVTDGAARA